eukprot:GCRY01005954.1.p1 GENE.GCRY01005954.1~~GCRY01005954.1.p1  ORF type:complete len:279 (-),score=46.16 GCRY01005954.1:22-858(-)
MRNQCPSELAEALSVLQKRADFASHISSYPKHLERQALRDYFTVFDPTTSFSQAEIAAVEGLLRNEIANLTVSLSSISEARDIRTDGSHTTVLHWQGDITLLEVDAIVNAANSRLLGCFTMGHHCIDNEIQSQAGPQLRKELFDIIKSNTPAGARIFFQEPTGCVRLTHGHCLPAPYILHTVGPIVNPKNSHPTAAQSQQLASCYRACLEEASRHQLSSIAFCCISTGEFGYPKQLAAELALETIKDWVAHHPSSSVKHVVFNTFTNEDAEIYSKLLA